jgi:peptidoglycan hydrolase-like protein with peptidoglycan-binding domain
VEGLLSWLATAELLPRKEVVARRRSTRPVLWRLGASVLAAGLAVVGPAGPAEAAGDPAVAALQVGLQARRVYNHSIDGIAGPQTDRAIRRLQRKARVRVDGVVDRRTRAALGRLGRPAFGTRVLRLGVVGWDVSMLQFLLASHGFPLGVFDGRVGWHTQAAIRRFQRWARLPVDGVAGPATFAALRAPPAASPILLSPPLAWPPGDGFGPRGRRFHAGIDFPAPRRTPVVASEAGRVVWAGRRRGGWGLLVTVAHGNGVRTMYAHLARIDVRLGQRVAAGRRLGLVGASGNASGPHLHYEVRLRGAAIDPLTALR